MAAPAPTLDLSVVKKFCPKLVFHPDEEYFPCSIEHLLQNSCLSWDCREPPHPILGQATESQPSITTFQGALYMVYNGLRSHDIYITRSRDGLLWENTHRLLNFMGDDPTIATFKDALWVVCHDPGSSQLRFGTSADGFNFRNQEIHELTGAFGSKVALAVFNDSLYMVYIHGQTSEIEWTVRSQPNDGSAWSQPQPIRPIAGTGRISRARHLALTANSQPGMDYMLLVYCANDWQGQNQYYERTFANGVWGDAIPIRESVAGGELALSTFHGDKHCLLFNDHLFRLHESISQVGRPFGMPNTPFAWSRGVWVGDMLRPPPSRCIQGKVGSMCIMNKVLYIVFTAHTHIYTASWEPELRERRRFIQNPTIRDLESFNNLSRYIKGSPDNYPGQSISLEPPAGVNDAVADDGRPKNTPPLAPMYYAVQTFGESGFVIFYIFLFAYRGPQRFGFALNGTYDEHNLSKVGEQEGDLQRFAAFITRSAEADADYELIQCGLEEDGKLISYPPYDCIIEEESHAVIYVGLMGHSLHIHRPALEEGQFVAFVIPLPTPGLASLLSVIAKGQSWEAWQNGSKFKRLGINRVTGMPVSNQIWSAFKGRLGRQFCDLVPTPSPALLEHQLARWSFCSSAYREADRLGLIPHNLKNTSGPRGPGARDWIMTDVDVSGGDDDEDDPPSDGGDDPPKDGNDTPQDPGEISGKDGGDISTTDGGNPSEEDDGNSKRQDLTKTGSYSKNAYRRAAPSQQIPDYTTEIRFSLPYPAQASFKIYADPPDTLPAEENLRDEENVIILTGDNILPGDDRATPSRAYIQYSRETDTREDQDKTGRAFDTDAIEFLEGGSKEVFGPVTEINGTVVQTPKKRRSHDDETNETTEEGRGKTPESGACPSEKTNTDTKTPKKRRLPTKSAPGPTYFTKTPRLNTRNQSQL